MWFHSNSHTTQSASKGSASSRESRVTNHIVMLSKIELPKFDGDVVQWFSFRDMFVSLVHMNQSISEIERFHFIIHVRSRFSSYQVYSVSCSITWNALQGAFENNRLLATMHIDKLFAFSRLKKEAAASLSAFVNTS